MGYFAGLINPILISNVVILFRQVFKDGFVLSVVQYALSELVHSHPFEIFLLIWQAK